MCLFPSGGKKETVKEKRSDERPYELPKESPRYKPEPKYSTWRPETSQQKITKAMGEGPAPTVMGAQKSSSALSNRRRKLLDAFKYGLSSQLLRKTTARRG